ncbi:MAG TPA: transcription antitermination factor NusB [Amaricoccus sp.]|nr:transcription antitermination factor NusB [Amaricoccus sp.]
MGVPGLAARRAAAALLAGVLDKRRSLDDQEAPLAGLEPGERARARSLAAETLRHLGRIDALLAGFLRRPPPEPAMNALRLATAEMHLDAVPAHAAVDAAVRLVRSHPGGARLSGLVNAVARRVADGGPPLWDAAPEAGLPDWLAGPVDAAWGVEARRAIEAAQRARPPVDLTPKRPEEAGAWAAVLGAERLPTGSLRLAARPQLSGLPGYAEGAWWVQDAAAALPVRLLGTLAGRTALDLCAAPGGKTMQLAAAGAAVVAVDASAARLGRLRANLARTGLAAETVVADALAWEPGRRFAAVLLDAPCTASGTIRRHPDLPWLRTGLETARLVAAQAALIRRAWGWVAPGGRLVYCVCSLLPEEGEAQAARFLAETPEARVVPPELALGLDPAWIDPGGALRTRPDFWPGRGGLDGFYAVCLERPASRPPGTAQRASD